MSSKETKIADFQAADKKRKEHKQRRHQQKLMFGTIVVLVITIISFVFVPALAGRGGNSGSLVFGKYGKRPIRFQQGNYFSRQVESINNMYRDSLGNNGNMDFMRRMIWQSAFNKAVVRAGILEELAASDAGVSSRRIDKAIVESGMFSEDGAFNEAAYLEASPGRLREIRISLEEDLLVQTYYNDTLASRHPSEKMTDFLLGMGKKERNLAYARLPFSLYPEEQVKSWGKEHANLFEKRDIRRITISSSEEEAKGILKKLDTGESSFEELAKAWSKDAYAKEGGLVSSAPMHQLLSFLTEEQAASVMALPEGTHSDLIQQGDSWYIFQADSPVQKADFDQDEMITELRSYLEREEIGMIEDYLLARGEEIAREASAQSGDFDVAAEKLGAEKGETGFISAIFGNIPFLMNSPAMQKDVPFLKAAAYSDEFFEKAFSLKASGDVSSPMVLEKAVLVFSLKEERDAEEQEAYKSYLEYQVKNELTRSQQSVQEDIFLKSPLLKDDFSKTYNRIFPQG